MKVTNYYGKEVKCIICGSENLHEYKTYTPPFVDAINSVFIGWCIEHKGEGLKKYNEAIAYTDRINQANSNS